MISNIAVIQGKQTVSVILQFGRLTVFRGASHEKPLIYANCCLNTVINNKVRNFYIIWPEYFVIF